MVDESEEDQSCFKWIKRRKFLDSAIKHYFEDNEKIQMADPSNSETAKSVERSRRNFWKQIPISTGERSASSLEMHKENLVRKNSESSSNLVKRLQMRYEELSKSQKNVLTVDRENYRTAGAIKKRVVNKEEKNSVPKKRVGFADYSVEILHPAKKRNGNEDHKNIGMKNRPDFGDENKICAKSRAPVACTENDVFAKPRFKVWADELPLSKQESITTNEAAKSNENSAVGESVKNRRLDRLIAESENMASDRFTPIDAQVAPLIPKKIKVQHRKGAKTENKATTNSQTWESMPYMLPYEDNLVKFELAKEKPLSRMARGLRNKNITVEQRKIILKFLIHLNTHKFWPSFLLYQAVRIFDAVLDAKMVSVENIQLVALTAMWIALKREQITYKLPSATEMISYSKDLYQGRVDLLIRCEMELLQILNFEIVFPDPFSVLYYYITTCNRSQFMVQEQVELAYYCGGYMIDLSLFDEDLMQTSAVLLAAAAAETALFFAMEEVEGDQEPMWFKWRSPDAASRFNDAEIVSVSTKLINLINNSTIRHTEGEIVFKKYSRSRYCKVSHFLCNKVRLLLSVG